MRRAWPTVLVLCAGCGEVGLTVDVSSKPEVGSLDELRIEVTQSALLVEQTFTLNGKKLPQSVAVVTKGLTRGQVEVLVQGLGGGRVLATARVTGELKPASAALHVSAVLEKLCPPAVPQCGCTPVTCASNGEGCGRVEDGCGGVRECGDCMSAAEVCVDHVCQSRCEAKGCAGLRAQCGMVLDCGKTLDCGGCDAGSTCGAAGVPNVCGPGPCVPRTQCDAGFECGSQSDGCGHLLTCGSCDAGLCGTDLRCGCVPLTQCPNGMNCGVWPNGCGTNISCGNCSLPQTCGGGGVQNHCGCTPLTSCPADACAYFPDGCGTNLTCSAFCPGGRGCQVPGDGGSPRCRCPANSTDCGDAGCVDLASNETNCGACGNVCPFNQQCRGGLCPCVDAGSNSDGHCCPPGWVLEKNFGPSPNTRCYLGPFDAGTQAEGLAACLVATDAGYGRATSALGSGVSAFPGTAVPVNACGSFLQGTAYEVFDAEAANSGSSHACNLFCSGAQCVCSTCACAGTNRACEQPFYCVMDPLGPRVEGPCGAPYDCPPGMTCASGNCVDAGRPFCVADADCGVGKMCIYRGGGMTGLCN